MAPLTAANQTPDTDPAHFPGGTTVYPGTGKSYIADPAREGPVTGSPLPDFIACPNSDLCTLSPGPGVLTDHNIFRIEGPPGSEIGGPGIDFIETTDFTLVGRLFEGQIPSLVTVDRASYTRNVGGVKVEVFAGGFATSQARLPNTATPAAVMPILSFFDVACTGTVDPGGTVTPMFNADNNFWNEAQPLAIPTDVCVKDIVTTAYFPKDVVDDVTITEALYDPTAQTLSVKARSSDATGSPALTLEGFGLFTGGAILVSPLAAPPASVLVSSAAGGMNESQVTIASTPTGVTLLANPVDNTTPGNSVTFTATNVIGGTGPFEYEFRVMLPGGSTFLLARSYIQSDNWTWDSTGAPTGDYQFQVNVRNVGSTAPAEATDTIPYALTTTVTTPTGVTLTANPVDNTTPGNSVTFTATNVIGGTGPFEYEFRVMLPGGSTFLLARSYNQSDNWTWDSTGAPTGDYQFQVNVRNVGSTAPAEATDTIPYALLAATVTTPTGVTLIANPVDNTTPGNSVTFTATNVIGGTGPFEYEFRVMLPGGSTFLLARSYIQSDNWTWDTTGAPIGDYQFQVNVRNVGSTAPAEATDTIPYVLTTP